MVVVNVKETIDVKHGLAADGWRVHFEWPQRVGKG
jgi:hypothetical protein